MSMGFSQGLSLGLRQSTELSQRQTLTQTELLNQRLSHRSAVLEALYGESFRPEATCPQCSHALSIAEIIQGFRQDPADYTTGCPKCGRRFNARIVTRGRYHHGELPFYCAMQTVDQLRRVEILPFEQFAKEHPALVQSARFHYGSLTAAFRQAGREFTDEPKPDWKERIVPFLGQCSDALIANLVGKAKSTIWRLRRKREIRPFRR